MKTIEATYRIVTPMFIGGADQSPSDGIRPPSFKGALRFWWRALNWGEFYQQHDGDEKQALKTLHAEECRLFGSAVKNGNGGQGVFLLKIDQPQLWLEENQWPKAQPLGDSGYLGMGLWESGKKEKNNFQPHRVAIFSDKAFKVQLLLKGNRLEGDCNQLSNALKALGLFGGLGSRSRRGFGSICLETLNGELFTCADQEGYQSQIQELINTLKECELMPLFTAWSLCARVGILKNPQKTAKDAHKQSAKLFHRIRGMKAVVRGKDKRGFGQPLPLKPMKKEYAQRRASPLIFHVHPVGNQFVCNHIFMPAQFLPTEGSDMSFYNGVGKYMDELVEVAL